MSLDRGKESACNTGDVGLIPGSGRSPGGGTLCSILAWEIPCTEEPGGLQSFGSQRVRHDLVTEHAQVKFEQERRRVL